MLISALRSWVNFVSFLTYVLSLARARWFSQICLRTFQLTCHSTVAGQSQTIFNISQELVYPFIVRLSPNWSRSRSSRRRSSRGSRRSRSNSSNSRAGTATATMMMVSLQDQLLGFDKNHLSFYMNKTILVGSYCFESRLLGWCTIWILCFANLAIPLAKVIVPYEWQCHLLFASSLATLSRTEDGGVWWRGPLKIGVGKLAMTKTFQLNVFCKDNSYSSFQLKAVPFSFSWQGIMRIYGARNYGKRKIWFFHRASLQFCADQSLRRLVKSSLSQEDANSENASILQQSCNACLQRWTVLFHFPKRNRSAAI